MTRPPKQNSRFRTEEDDLRTNRKIASMCENLGRCSVPSAHNTSTGSAEPLTSKPNERMKGGLQGDPESWISRPESEKWETPIRKEPGNWEKTPSRTAGLPDWPGMSDRRTRRYK